MLIDSDGPTGSIGFMSFQLWSLLLLQGKVAKADALFQTIRLQHPLSRQPQNCSFGHINQPPRVREIDSQSAG